ncbi:MAG: response regulator [Lysobacteraceae bacterium]|nr:MAG: response regulator [Xanthomonadaceae bacterium]
MLRILLVEDSADDAALLRIELGEAGLHFQLLQVDSERALRDALQAFEPDVAISDLNLPGYSGLSALALIHQLRPRVPLLLFSGIGYDAHLPVGATVLEKSELPRLAAMLSDIAARG